MRVHALRGLSFVAAFVLLGLILGPQLGDLVNRPTDSAVDLIPLWCHARALAAGQWACGPAVMKEVLHHALSGPDTGRDGPYYYPPTAALLFLPTVAFSFETVAYAFRAISLVALVGAAFAVTFTAPPRDRALAFAAAVVLAGVYCSLRITRGCLLAGQTGPLMVGVTAAAVWAAGRDRDRVSGALAGVGVALKLSPILLFGAFPRRRSWALAALGTVLLLGALVLVIPGHDPLTTWLIGARAFADRPMRPEWPRQEPPWVLTLWSVRHVALGLPSVVIAAWSAARPKGREAELALAMLLIAFGGTVMAGSQQTHEALVLLPALGWVLVWPAQRGPFWMSLTFACGLAAYMVALGVGSRLAPPNSLAWLPLGFVTWVGCALRWGCARRVGAMPRASCTPPVPVDSPPAGTPQRSPPSLLRRPSAELDGKSPGPLVTLGEFSDGNEYSGSIGYNLPNPATPREW